MESERRGANRSPARLTAIFKNLQTGKVLRALTSDLSVEGMCLTTEGTLAIGMRLEVDLKLPDREAPVVCQAEVVWSRSTSESHKSYEVSPAQTGVKFLNLTSQDHAAIKHYTTLYGL